MQLSRRENRKSVHSFVKDGVGFIQLSNGKYAKCSPEDLSYLSQFFWSENSRGYAKANVHGKTVAMHTLVAGRWVDHTNREQLDNRRENLRPADVRLNGGNRSINKGKRFKGMTWIPRCRMWQTSIKSNGVKYHLGYFKSEEAAARAYDEKAKQLFGEFACLNFPQAV